MKTHCEECGNEFDDENYDKFGKPIRRWCNSCTDKIWKEFMRSRGE